MSATTKPTGRRYRIGDTHLSGVDLRGADLRPTTEATPRLAAVTPASELAAGIRAQIGVAPEEAATAPADSVRAAALAVTESGATGEE